MRCFVGGVAGVLSASAGVCGARLTSTVGCAKVGELKAKKAFKAANQAYQQQDYKKAAELYEETRREPTRTCNQAYFFLGNSYDNQYKPSKKGEADNDALLTKAVENYQMAAEKLSARTSPTTRSSASCRSSTWSPPTAPTS